MHFNLCEIHTSNQSESTEKLRVSYKLVAVVVHIGSKLSSGHYVCYMKRNGLWYCADDAHIKECTAFEATNQQAYLLFYERGIANDPEVETSEGKGSFTPQTKTEKHPLRFESEVSEETIQIQRATPPSFYVMEPWCDVRAPAVCKTAKHCPGLQYMPICDSEKEQAELIVTNWVMPSNTTPEQRAGKLETFAGFCQDRRETAPG